MSQIDFAAAAKISSRNLVRLENDQVKPRADTVARIAEASGQPSSFFESDDDDEEPHPVSLDELLKAHVRRLVSEAFARETAA